MNSVQQSRRQYTLDEYFSLQRGVELKLEYYDGEIHAMAGGSADHNRVSRNVLRAFDIALAGTRCEPFGSDMRISTPSGLYTYPDASIVCGETVSGNTETISNPVVIVEVLSPSTRDYDRGDKFALYRSIPSLRHVLFIEPSSVHVEHRRLDDEGNWSSETVNSIDRSIPLGHCGFDLALRDVYARVESISPDFQ